MKSDVIHQERKIRVKYIIANIFKMPIKKYVTPKSYLRVEDGMQPIFCMNQISGFL
jgi:hypothetical protein